MKHHIMILYLLLANFNINAQILFYQDVCNCGVTGAGFSTSMGDGSGQFSIYIEPGSTIRKAYLFTDKKGNADPIQFPMNNILINPINSIASFEEFGPFLDARDITIYAEDVTNLININELTYNITIPPQINGCSGCSYNSVYLYVIYENPLFVKASTYIYINNIDGNYIVDYSSKPFNPISSNAPVAFALFSDRIGISPDGSYLSFNNGGGWNNVGMIAGEDQVNNSWGGGGVKGHFYYQNNQLFGLDDDTPDYIVGGSDGLVDISPFALSGSTLDWRLQWETNSPNGRYNIYNSFFITHSSPCQPFDVSVPKDTTICKGITIKLNASGGQSYEWLSPTNSTSSNPAPGLSCSNCPNPIFTADSSMFYTVRIWNNDTSTGSACSVVRPVKITVKKPPVLPQLSTVKAQCGVASGSIGIKNPKESGNLYILSENGDTLVKPIVANQNTNQGGLFGGTYTVYFQDAFGCTSGDTTLTIGTINNTIANFTATPQSGSAPLEVTITNTSQNAQQFQWFVNGELQPNPFTSFVADTSGSYQITLVAWKNDPSCADTAQLTVIAYDSLIVGIPNVFSPNNDGVNDNFSITVNQPVKCELVIVNRWGEKVYAYSGNLTVGMNDLWSADATVSDGVYFYSVKMETSPPPLSPSKGGNPHQLSREGFVTVVR